MQTKCKQMQMHRKIVTQWTSHWHDMTLKSLLQAWKRSQRLGKWTANSLSGSGLKSHVDMRGQALVRPWWKSLYSKSPWKKRLPFTSPSNSRHCSALHFKAHRRHGAAARSSEVLGGLGGTVIPREEESWLGVGDVDQGLEDWSTRPAFLRCLGLNVIKYDRVI